MNEKAKVGLVVLVAGGLLVAGVFFIANIRVGKYAGYKTYLKSAGGLEPGTPVRFAGLKVGRVQTLRVDPNDPTRVEIHLEVKADTPIRSDSTAALAQLGLLGENYVEIKPGKSGSRLPEGSAIPSQEAVDIAELTRKMSGLMDQAQPLIADVHKNLNEISAQADKLIVQLQGFTTPENQRYVNSIMKQTDDMIRRTSPKVDALVSDLRNATAKLETVMKNADGLVNNANGMVGENRENIRTTILDLQKTLANTRAMVDQLNSTVTYTSENLDSTLANFRAISENFREFSETLKQRPYSLVRIKPLPDRRPPGASKQ